MNALTTLVAGIIVKFITMTSYLTITDVAKFALLIIKGHINELKIYFS